MQLFSFFLLIIFLPSILLAEIKTEHITYKDGTTELEGVLAYDPEIAKRPGVLLVHEWWGRNDYVIRRAKEYAALGYVAFALDMYGKGVLVKTADEAKALSTPFYQDRDLFKRRVNAGLKMLQTHSRVDGTKLAALGYCFGGAGVLELARSGATVKGVIAFHGGLSTPHTNDVKSIHTKVLVLAGAEDPFVPKPEVEAFKAEMDKAKIDYQLIEYPGAQHAFTNESVDALNIKGAAYNKTADLDSFKRSETFLSEVLK